MNKLILAVLAILLAFILIAAPTAQAATDKCDPAPVLAVAQALKSTGNAKVDLGKLNSLKAQIIALETACSGFAWSGTGSLLSDPFDLPKGSYRVELKSTDASAELKSVADDDCRQIFLANVTGAVKQLRIDQKVCRYTLEISYADNVKWEVAITPLK